jgi:DNA-binding HxlR family transcriptional regulator
MMNASFKTPALEVKTGCLEAAMQVIGNKWTALILRDLAAGEKGFCELQKSVGDINPRTLSQRLDDLAAHAIISKDSSAARPTYALTKKGHDLIPVLQSMSAWGEKYYAKP